MPWESLRERGFTGVTDAGLVRIGLAIRRRRERLYVSQHRLARISGFNQSTISRIENGKLGNLRWPRFAYLIGCLGGLGDEPPPPWFGFMVITGWAFAPGPEPYEYEPQPPPVGRQPDLEAILRRPKPPRPERPEGYLMRRCRRLMEDLW